MASARPKHGVLLGPERREDESKAQGKTRKALEGHLEVCRAGSQMVQLRTKSEIKNVMEEIAAQINVN